MRRYLSIALVTALRRPAALVGALALTALLFAGAVRSAEAHAVLVRSAPASQTGLRAPPASIDLWFSEPLEPKFSDFELFASNGRTLPLDGMRIDPTDGKHLSALPRALEPDVYTVVYRTLSTRDGHEWSGALTFTVLSEDGSVPSGSAFSADLGGATSPAEVAGRWFTFTGLAAILGGAAMVLFVVGRGEAGGGMTETAGRLYRLLLLAALPLLLGGAGLVLQSQYDKLGGSLTALLSETRFGTLWLWRALAVLALTVTAALLFIAARRRCRRWEQALTVALFALGAGALVTVSLLSHAAAAPGRFWAVLADFGHLGLASVWTGGLLFMAALFVRERRRRGAVDATLLVLLGRFSVFAAAAIYLLGATGVLRALGEFPTAGAITSTSYGRWLLIKLALLTPMLGVAVVNHGLAQRGSASAAAAVDATRRLRRLLPLEAALGVVVLGSVAVLGQLPAARGGETRDLAGLVIPFNRVVQVDDLSMHLQVTPARVGPNELRVHLYRPDGSDPGAVERVRLTLTTALASGGGGGDVLDAIAQGDGIYTASTTFTSLSRTWDVTIDARRTGFDDARGQFRVPVESAATGAGDRGAFDSPAPQLHVNVLWAFLLIATGLGLVVSQRRRRTWPGGVARWGGVSFIFVALMLSVSAEQHTHGGSSLVNPSVNDPASVARGAPLFATNCAACHGASGRGDGPQAAGLRRPPADLTLHVPLHSDGDTFIFISEGLPGTAMAAWKSRLSEQQIWDLVNYLRRTFSAAGGGDIVR